MAYTVQVKIAPRGYHVYKNVAYTVQAKIASRGYHVCKNVNWENVKAGEKVTIQIETNKDYQNRPVLLCGKSYGRKSCQIGHCRSYSQRNFKACLLFFERRRWKSGRFSFLHKI